MESKKDYSGGLSIIVIEDNPGDFVLIEDYLIEKFESISIRQFTDYKSVSYFLQEENHNSNLILLDLNLPDVSGLTLVKNMISLSSLIPIIILTGYADLPLAKKSLELGVYDFLVKDEVNPALLHKSIEFAISRSSYVRQIERQNEKLKNIAWTQSHVVRAPLARILGIMNLIEENPEDHQEMLFWLKHLRNSTNEMDEVVQKIVNEAQTIN
ncbi:MAG: response regulator [Balneolales bacterium]|nr:response regulator [Balneolales bacterium]